MKLVPVLRRDKSVRTWTAVSDEDFVAASATPWYLHSGGYVTRDGSTVLLHRQIAGINNPAVKVDHVNGDRLDNQRTNLRVSTTSQNGQNRHELNANNASGYRGVHWLARERKWRAVGTLEYKRVCVGYYDDPAVAAAALAAWRAEHMPFSQEAAQLKETACWS
ncbi:MAG: HNH endonuclease [Actinomycetota bacterium]|nr:HNH endonuclease [Actinomycetota bacterium]